MKNKRFMKNKAALALIFGAALMLGMSAAGCGKGKTPSENPEAGQEKNSAQAGSENQEDRTEGQINRPVEQENQPGLGTFEAKTLDGETFTQEDIAKKDATLINFWTTYCGPCIEEMPKIAEFAKTLPDNVQIITVCLDTGTEADSAKEILEKAGFSGATLVSGDGGLAEVVGGIMYTPTTIVVDQEGNVVGDAIIGGQKNLEETFTASINEALKAAGKTEIGNGDE